MRFRLDENLDPRLAVLLCEEEDEADTVRAEGLSGQSDDAIYRAIVAGSRVLVTLDLDFANPFRFAPASTAGIVIVRPPRPILPMIRATLAAALPQLRSRPLTGKLWIVEPGRIRVYEPPRRTRCVR